jgi:hypothetical protein
MFDNSSGQVFKKKLYISPAWHTTSSLASIRSLFHGIHNSKVSFLCTSKNTSIPTYIHTSLAFPLHANKKINLSKQFQKFLRFFNFQKFKNFQKFFRATLLC